MSTLLSQRKEKTMLELILICGGVIGFGTWKAVRQEEYDRRYVETVVNGIRYKPQVREAFKREDTARKFQIMYIERIERNMGKDSHDYTLASRVCKELKNAVEADLHNERIKQ